MSERLRNSAADCQKLVLAVRDSRHGGNGSLFQPQPVTHFEPAIHFDIRKAVARVRAWDSVLITGFRLSAYLAPLLCQQHERRE